jgi:RNA polymerase sigma-70 factor (ECF subfamily)
MSNDHGHPSEEEGLLRRAGAGDEEAVGELFARHRPRLQKMLGVRLDRRLHRRLDPSDVLQDVYLEMVRRIPEYMGGASVPFYVWLRSLAGQRLMDLHRRHLGAQMRAVDLEVSLHRGALPQASSLSLAQQLVGHLTSPTKAAARAELQVRLQEALNAMEPIDREIIVLRHFEELSNVEAADVLGIQKSAASKRYLRAVRRLREVLAGIPGFLES